MEKGINKDTGLKLDILSLSRVLKIGITVEYSDLDGKEPNSRDLLKMYVSGELIKGAFHLRILIEISSYPFALFVFHDFIIFDTKEITSGGVVRCDNVDLQFRLFLCKFHNTILLHSWPLAREVPVGVMDPLVIYKIHSD